jgi:hypothetical protein
MLNNQHHGDILQLQPNKPASVAICSCVKRYVAASMEKSWY